MFKLKASHCSGYVGLLGETSLSLGMGLAGLDLIAFSLKEMIICCYGFGLGGWFRNVGSTMVSHMVTWLAH